MAHKDTVFAQVLKLVPRQEFESLARKHKSGRMSRSMTRWGQFVAMGMAQLTGRCSLRDIVSNLAAPSCKLYHLGVGVVTRSSLARVNAEKPWEMYEELHGRLLGRCQAKAPGHGYRFKAKLFSVDSTTIDLCLSDVVPVVCDNSGLGRRCIPIAKARCSSSSAPALTGGCHGWHEAGSYPVIDDDALWNCGNLAAGAQASRRRRLPARFPTACGRPPRLPPDSARR